MPAGFEAWETAFTPATARKWIGDCRPEAATAFAELVRLSGISLLAAPLVLLGYRLTGRKRREGWWFLIASQGALLGIALVNRQYGLLIVAVAVSAQAFVNWRRWGARPAGSHAALWANDLTRLFPPATVRGEYVAVEVRTGTALTAELARAMGADEHVVLDRLARGCRAFAWDCLGEVVSWLWVSIGEEFAPPIRQALQIPEGDCHGWAAGTLENHRDRGLCAGLLEYAGWCMAREGRRVMWNGILNENLASQRAHAHAGFLPVLHLAMPAAGLQTWAVEYADPRLVARAREMVGVGQTERPVVGARGLVA